MTTQEVANRFTELYRQNKIEEIYKELYAPQCSSHESPGSEWPAAEGMEAIQAKGKKWQEMVEEFHGSGISDPVVAGRHFTLGMWMDITYKGKERMTDNEVCVYEVADGKIVSERFFY